MKKRYTQVINLYTLTDKWPDDVLECNKDLGQILLELDDSDFRKIIQTGLCKGLPKRHVGQDRLDEDVKELYIIFEVLEDRKAKINFRVSHYYPFEFNHMEVIRIFEEYDRELIFEETGRKYSKKFE